ncbi:TPA: hypothetical protein SLV86_001297 [Pseudomonas aeruginosa]|nr:hypothetical protein [Pseudomonas aeruginosa]HEJ2039543.1 hypothetical protein [Pseudomonas aeruginosa]
MRRFLLGLVALAVIGTMFGRGSTDEPIRQKGYFRGVNSDRVFTFEMASGVTAQDAQAHAAGQPYTSGQMTTAYYYVRGSTIPADGVTGAASLSEVNRVLYEVQGLSPWVFAYQRGRNGQVVFVDCRAGANDLCR